LLRKPAAVRSLGRPGCRWNNIKMDLEKLGSRVCLPSSDSEQGPGASFCLYSNKPLNLIKFSVFIPS